MSYKWLLFDADDTLFDYDLAEAYSLEQTFAQFDLQYRSNYLINYRRINSMIWQDLEAGRITQGELRSERFRLLFNEIRVDCDPAKFSDQYLLTLGTGYFLVPGAEQLIKKLHGRYGLAILTNGLQEVQRARLNGSKLKAYFDHLIISEEIGAAKPDPRFFKTAFEVIGNPSKSEVLMIGDRLESDIKGGTDFGIDTCWFNYRNKNNNLPINPTYIIRQLEELLVLLN